MAPVPIAARDASLPYGRGAARPHTGAASRTLCMLAAALVLAAASALPATMHDGLLPPPPCLPHTFHCPAPATFCSTI